MDKYAYWNRLLGQNIGYKVGKFELEYDNMMGVFCWRTEKGSVEVFATPYWEGADGIAVTAVDHDKVEDIVLDAVVRLPEPSMNHALDFARYVNRMKHALQGF